MESLEEIKEKIKSIQSWSWYFEENEFDDFYEIFRERYPEVELDEKKIKRIGKALAKGKEIPVDIKEEIQGNNVAFKCTYNDSGFNGRCSEELCKFNWEHGGSWCRDQDNPCREGENFPCMESEIWNKHEFGAGSYLKGDKAGEKKSLRNVREGKIAILTTRKVVKSENGFEKRPEEERKIFGILLIDGIKEDNSVVGDKENFIRIDDSVNLKFWDYHKNKDPESVAWSSGLFRYLTDEEVSIILQSLKEEYVKKNLNQTEIEKIERLIKKIQT